MEWNVGKPNCEHLYDDVYFKEEVRDLENAIEDLAEDLKRSELQGEALHKEHMQELSKERTKEIGYIHEDPYEDTPKLKDYIPTWAKPYNV